MSAQMSSIKAHKNQSTSNTPVGRIERHEDSQFRVHGLTPNQSMSGFRCMPQQARACQSPFFETFVYSYSIRILNSFTCTLGAAMTAYDKACSFLPTMMMPRTFSVRFFSLTHPMYRRI